MYLKAWALIQPSKPAYLFYGHQLSYKDLHDLSLKFATLLGGLGYNKGDRIAVFLPNIPQFAIVFFGILLRGCIHVPINPSLKKYELLSLLNDSGAVAIVTLDRLACLVAGIRLQTSVRTLIVTSYADAVPVASEWPLPFTTERTACVDTLDLMTALSTIFVPDEPQPPDLDDCATINYTGGTTGLPKGCIHTHRNMLYTASTACTVAPGMDASDTVLCVYKLFWITGENVGLLFPIFAGATCVLLSTWDPLVFLKAVERYRVTRARLFVDATADVTAHPAMTKYDLSSLRSLDLGVQQLTAKHRSDWRRCVGITARPSGWGMTETHASDTYTVGMQDGDRDLVGPYRFIGLPMPGTVIKVCDHRTGATLPIGVPGEMWVKTPSLFRGYWNDAAYTATALVSGWLRTGDAGLIDEQGYLYYVGRFKEMLKVNGVSVFPAEVERILVQHPYVACAAVVGRPDGRRGEMPVAFVCLTASGPSRTAVSELRRWCRTNMAAYKLPELRALEAMPTTATGKVDKDQLRRLL